MANYITHCWRLSAIFVFVVTASVATSAPAVHTFLSPSNTPPYSNKNELDVNLAALIESLALKATIPSSKDVPVPSGPMFELGLNLFYTKTLSANGDVPCVSCHHPKLGGGDGLSLPVGVDAVNPELLGIGRTHDGNTLVDSRADGSPNVPRNASTIFNIQLLKKAAFWDGRVEIIQDDVQTPGVSMLRTPDSRMNLPDSSVADDFIQAQAKFPITAIHEMFGHGPDKRKTNNAKRQQVLAGFLEVDDTGRDNPWLPLFQTAFDDSSTDPEHVITIDRISTALAFFQRSMWFVENPWFEYLAGNSEALSDEAKRGAMLFFSKPSNGGYSCNGCHSGSAFTDEQFHNIAMPQIGRGKDTDGNDHGRLLHTFNVHDKYAFRTPILLNIDVTGPYGHSGAFHSLADVIKHHMAPEASVVEFDYSLSHLPQFAGVKVNQERNKTLSYRVLKQFIDNKDSSKLQTGLVEEKDVNALVAFLKSLTDPCINSSDCLKPWSPVSSKQEQTFNLLRPEFSASQINSVSNLNLAQEPENSASDEQVRAIDDKEKALNAWFIDASIDSGLRYELPQAEFTDEYHLMGGGVAVDDINKDGWPDVFISHAMQPGKLFINNQKGGFTDETSRLLGDLSGRQLGALFIDYDADGRKDLLLVGDDIFEGYFRVFNQLPSGKFASFTKGGINFSRFTHSLSAGDFDKDGDLDLFASHWGDTRTKNRKGYLWENTGKGRYQDVSSRLPDVRPSPLYPNLDVNFTPIFTDIDMDNDLDLLIAADYETSQVMVNEEGIFKDKTHSVISDENGMGAAVGDFDNDGDFDWFVTAISNPIEEKTYIGGDSGNRLYQNNGTGVFTDVTDVAGVREGYWGWGACFADFNNDGWLDIFHTNGMRTGTIAEESQVGQFYDDPSRLFINNRDGTFTQKSRQLGLTHTAQGRGVSCTDFDGNGTIDILIANNGAAPTYYKNTLKNANHFLTVKLVAGQQNPDAIGAKLWLKTASLNQVRELRLGSNYLSNDFMTAHFGIPQNDVVDYLEILWPDGHRQRLTKFPLDKVLTVRRQ